MSKIKRKGYDFWRNDLKEAKLVVAPMVDQSELPWRMLSRRHGAQLCYTPMLHSSLFAKDPIYRKEFFTTCPEDRPLIAQFCTNDPETFVKAAQFLESHCDAVDLNLGCPQIIAKKGHYGAFLQDEWDLISKIVSLAHEKLSIPITCKIRVFDDLKKTIEYARMLEKAGCQLLTVHGRTRDQKGPKTGLANWDYIKAVKQSVSIPVFANGNIQYFKDIQACMEYTGVDGIMTAEGNLHNPALLGDRQPMVWEMAEEYLDLVDKYPCQLSAVRGHLFKLHFHSLCKHTDLREVLGDCKSLEEVKKVNQELTERLKKDAKENTDKPVSYTGLPHWVCQPYERPSPKDNSSTANQAKEKDSCKGESENKVLAEKKLKKALKRKKLLLYKSSKVPVEWVFCSLCKTNPMSKKCEYQYCRHCCKEKTALEKLDCPSHRFWFHTGKKKKFDNDDTHHEEEQKTSNTRAVNR
uniref:tRNA-dihydrouridine(16/17) synthase [NAD(P)(+)]-like n=1 Tax=Actinia tenebrosa TaxID=6105 RepID=A0A6P8HGW5_ACTTE